MINAVLKEKADIQRNEDVKTSSIIGLLTLLPAELFWKLLKSSLSEQHRLPVSSGDILSIESLKHSTALSRPNLMVIFNTNSNGRTKFVHIKAT